MLLESFDWQLLHEHISDLISTCYLYNSQSILGDHVISYEHVAYLNVLGLVVELRICCKLSSSLIVTV